MVKSSTRNIMPLVAVSSAEHIFWILMTTTTMMPVFGILPRATTLPPSLISPACAPAAAPAPSSFPPQQPENQVPLGKDDYVAELSEIALEDYGLWNPTPCFGRGNMAPIPH